MASPSNRNLLEKLRNELANLKKHGATKNNLAKLIQGSNNNKRIAAIVARMGYGHYPGHSYESYKLKDGAKTPFFDGRLRRFWYSPEIGFYIKVFNPRTKKIVTIPRRGIFRYQNTGMGIVPYRARRLAQPVSRSPARNIKRNAWLRAHKNFAGYKENNVRPENLYKYYR